MIEVIGNPQTVDVEALRERIRAACLVLTWDEKEGGYIPATKALAVKILRGGSDDMGREGTGDI